MTTRADGRRDHYRKLPFCCSRIVKACRAENLSPTHKLVWEEHRVLANDSRGAFISALALSARVGMSRATVERMRNDLKKWGLLSKRDGGLGCTDHWFPQLPIPYPSVKAIKDDDLDRCADLLARHITSLSPKGGRSLADDADEEPPSLREGGFPMRVADRPAARDGPNEGGPPSQLREVPIVPVGVGDGEDGEDGG